MTEERLVPIPGAVHGRLVFEGRIDVTEFGDAQRYVRYTVATVDDERRIVERDAEWKAACERAEALLMAHLNDEQRRSYLARHTFTVQVPSGRRYVIADGTISNVREVDQTGHPILAHCAYTPDVPVCDHMLAQKLLLQTDEFAFLAIAFSSDGGHSYPQGHFAEVYRPKANIVPRANITVDSLLSGWM